MASTNGGSATSPASSAAAPAASPAFSAPSVAAPASSTAASVAAPEFAAVVAGSKRRKRTVSSAPRATHTTGDVTLPAAAAANAAEMLPVPEESVSSSTPRS